MDVEGIYYCSKCLRKVADDTIPCPHCGYAPDNAAVNTQHLSEGTFLHDRYLLGAVIGAGGFGVTYAAWDANLHVPVAIKEFFPVKYAYRNTEESDDLHPQEESRVLFTLGLDRFRKEAQVLAQFQNVPGIVNINECFDENETAYIAMEFIHGIPLDQYVQEQQPSPKKLLDIMLPAINALETIHRQGVNHRDIKPENLLVQEDGSIKLIDFGSAREVEHVTNLIVVSDGYAPVEQYDLKQPQGPWGDIYSLSATIYHMLTGVMPEASISRAKNDTVKSPSKLGVRLKKYQEKALMAGLAVDPQKRIQSVAEFRALLYNMPLPEEVRRRKAFMRRVYTTAAVIVLLMAAVFVNFAYGFPLGGGLLYSLYPDGWHVKGYTVPQAAVTIPAEKLFLPVSAIEKNAFRDNHTLEELILPGSVRDLGSYSFANCANLATVKLGEGLVNIGDGAFSSCMNLLRASETPYSGDTSDMPKSLKHIGNYAFYNCDSLGFFRFYIGSKLESIGNYAFSDCFNLSGISLSYVSELTSIGDHAFSHCNNFQFIEFPDSLCSIGDQIFRECINLESINLPNGLTHIGAYAFYNCGKIPSITLPDALTYISDYTFYGCKGISIPSLTLPASLTHIGDYAFSDCDGIASFILPKSLIYIGNYAFESCSGLISPMIIPDSVTSIGAGAFASCTSLISITIPDSVTSIGAGAFSGCSSLTSLPILPDHVTSIGDDMFSHCAFTHITIPDSVTSIGEGAFAWCSSLTSITIPNSVTSIGAYAFSNCRSLTSIKIPDGVISIGERAFVSCESLTSITLPHSVTSFGPDIFLGSFNVTLSVPPDSHAHAFAVIYDIPYQLY